VLLALFVLASEPAHATTDLRTLLATRSTRCAWSC
jgi:hypothetical protein